MTIRFSVVIPTVGRPELLRRAISSVLGQAGVELDVVVVADGLDDDTASVVASLNDERVQLLSQPHAGRSAARNAGAMLARGDYLIFLDDDDELCVGALSACVDVATEARADVVSGGAVIVSPSGVEGTTKRPRPMGRLFRDRTFLVNAGAYVVKRDAFDAVGGFAAELDQSENHELFLRLCSAAAVHGWSFATVDACMLRRHRGEPKNRADAKLRAAQYYLSHYQDDAYASQAIVAQWHTQCGVNAARLRRFPEARAHFRRAAETNPTNLATWVRLVASRSEAVMTRYWRLRQE